MEHRISWFVHAGGELVPHAAGMRGSWGYDARCSCGWESRTGGAVRSYVAELVRAHKREIDPKIPLLGETKRTSLR